MSQAPRKKSKKNTNAAASVDGGSKKTTASSAAADKEAKNLIMKQRAKTRGVQCACCGERDDSPDPLEPHQNRLWGYYVPLSKELMTVGMGITLITDGAPCWFCLRVWNSIYISQMTLTNFKLWIGAKEENFAQYNRYLHWLIQQMSDKFKSTGTRKVSLKWPDPWKLKEQQILRIRWVKPPAEFMEEAAYKVKWGKPEDNGDVVEKGPGGVLLVKLRSQQIWKRKEEIISDSIKERGHIGEDADDVDREALDKRHQDLANSFGRSSSSKPSPTGSDEDTAQSAKPKGKAKAKAKGKAAEELPAEDVLYNKMSGSGYQPSFVSPSKSDNSEAPLHTPSKSAGFGADDDADEEEKAATPHGKQKEGAGRQAEAKGAGRQAEAKGKAKAKAKSNKRPSEGGGGDGAKQKKGRPARASDLLLRAALHEFASSDGSYDKYYGASWTSHTSRNWSNYLNVISGMIEETTDEQALHVLEVLQKQGNAVRSVLSKMRSSGTTSLVAARTYNEKAQPVSSVIDLI